MFIIPHCACFHAAVDAEETPCLPHETLHLLLLCNAMPFQAYLLLCVHMRCLAIRIIQQRLTDCSRQHR